MRPNILEQENKILREGLQRIIKRGNGGTKYSEPRAIARMAEKVLLDADCLLEASQRGDIIEG